jgi:regulation of enolase protein 1 (concanavalin A-like superfamily)
MRRFLTTALWLTACGSLFCVACTSSNAPVAGGGSSETVIGMVVDSSGQPSVQAIVRLRRSDYLSRLPALAKSALYSADALTDSNGRFEITGIDQGSYRIEVNNGNAATLFACSLDVRDTVNLGTATLRPFATLIGAADTTGTANPQRFVQVAGQERLAAIGVDGRYRLADLPAGIFSLHVGTNVSGSATTIINNVQAVIGDTAVVRSPLPAPWTGASIGNETPIGGAMYANGRFTITGGGPDIWNTADRFHFVYQPWSGDGEIIARVADFEYGTLSSKAGLMFRETLDPASVQILVSLRNDSTTQDNDVVLHHRRTTAGLSFTQCHQYQYRAPQWLRLVRTGNVYTASISADGTAWTTVCADTVVMAVDIYIGMAVTSHDTTRLSTAVYENVTVK